MPLFSYNGFDGTGRKASGQIEAAGRNAALQRLREKGVFPSELTEEGTTETRSGRRFWQRRVSGGDLSVAVRQMATLLGAGLTLDEVLGTVADQIENPRLTQALIRAREEVVQGSALYAALEEQGTVFPDLVVNMVRVGENSGTLDEVLQRLADFLEEQARITARIRAALAYPLLMLIVGSGVLFFLVAFVVPKITTMLDNLGQALPLPTLILIRTNELIAEIWPLLLLILVAGFWGGRRYLRSTKGRLRLHQLLLRLPVVGNLNQLISQARLTRTLSTLLASGVPLLKALEIVRTLINNRVLQKALDETVLAVREGEGLAAPMRRSGAFPPMVVQMAAVGERSGDLEGMLLRVAETYESQADSAINGMLSLLEPLMILLMGTVVGYIVLAILLPIFEASQGLA
ncbi:MAG: type II secretion system inner membrane protein GspF [Desulfuromonadales bacterium]